MVKNALSAGAPLQTPQGELTALQDPLAGVKGEGWRKEGRESRVGEEMSGREKDGRGGRDEEEGAGEECSPQHQPVAAINWRQADRPSRPTV